MNPLRTLAGAVLLAGACLASHPVFAAELPKPKVGQWVPLFNGRDLEGWIPKIRGHPSGTNFANTFRVANGAIQVGYENYDGGTFRERFGHLFYKDSFAHYRIRVEYRFVGPQVKDGPGWAFRNSGIMVHGQTPESMELDQDFPVSIEVQLLGGSGTGKRTTANLCTPGTDVVMGGKLIRQHCTESVSKTYHGDQWVTCEVEVRGSKVINHYVEGDLVLSYTEPQIDLTDKYGKKWGETHPKLITKGTISLQSESHPVEFRKVEILLLEE